MGTGLRPVTPRFVGAAFCRPCFLTLTKRGGRQNAAPTKALLRRRNLFISAKPKKSDRKARQIFVSRRGETLENMKVKDTNFSLAFLLPIMYNILNNIFHARQSGREAEILQQVAAKLTWRHHQTLINRIKNYDEMIWYAEQTIENGWSSNVLDIQIDRELYKRQALTDKTTNFKDRLPAPQSDLAQQTIKDPYIFDFIESHTKMVEREIEDELVKHITKFLLELGTGFSFVGQQYHIEVDGQDFHIDLLFYNLKLRCYVVIELKANEFKPEYAGKLNFYVSAVDSMLKHESDNPTIGILLCKKKNKVIAEYALRNINSPISVNEYKLFDKLPKEYENILPTAEDIEKRIKL
jgi:predicted nuclease of restriction endonuclease-like (RecB) superfamily